jgi:hypothetical protein
MGNSITNPYKPSYLLKLDRILDPENEIFIGIGKSGTQVIRIGDYTHKYHKLLKFTKKEDILKYEFENDVTLILQKKENSIYMNCIDMYSNKFIFKPIDPIVKKFFKPIHMPPCSNDLDAIGEFIVSNSSHNPDK